MLRLLLTAIAVLLLVSVLSLVVSAAITLDYFRGAPETSDILLEWQTATELNTAGYFIMRWDDSQSKYVEYSEFIPAKGEGTTGATYDWQDHQVTDSVTYYYMLEEVERNNQAKQTYGPVTVTMGLLTATPSPTPSSTPTSTPTPTSSPEIQTTHSVPSLTDTPTPTPTNTPISQNTFAPTATTFAESPTPTATGSLEAASLPTHTPQPTESVFTATPVPPGMVAITTATAAAAASSQAKATAPLAGIIVSPLATAGVVTTPQPGQLPGAPNATRPAVKVTAPLLTPAPTEVSKAYPAGPAGGQPSSSGGADVQLRGTNWGAVGLAMGMFAVAVVLIAGAAVIIRFLFR